LSGEENETSLYLYQLLGDAGFEVRLGSEGRGVLADLPDETDGTSQGKFALRADIDALHIHDRKQVAYRSQREGVMHACGHDVHTAILVGAMSAVRQLHTEGKLPWCVRLRAIFQPAEETCQGAREMIRLGALDGVSAILALHVDPSRAVGRIGLRDGVVTAHCDDMHIAILGQGGHAARPHESRDPIVTAAQLINALYLHIPRATDSQDAVVITIGQIDGGDNANVIPEQVDLRGTVRTLDADVRRQTMDHIHRLAAGVAQTSENKINVVFGAGAPSIHNEAEVLRLLRQAASSVIGDPQIDEIARPSMGSEDFALYLEHVGGVFFRLGCAAPHAPYVGLHTPTFDVDEEAIRIGAKLMAQTAISWFDPARPPATPTALSAADTPPSTPN
jgi:amidohydrolase